MAITKESINSQDISVLAAWMLTHLVPDYFAAVTLEDSTITCTDADGNTLLTISGTSTIVLNAYKSASNVFTVSRAGVGACDYCTACANGAFIVWRQATAGNPMQQALLITKTNNDKTALVFSGAANYAGNVYCVAWGDAMPNNVRAYTPLTANQTQLVPFCTDTALGDVSYTPNAFYMPIGQYFTAGFGALTIDGVTYMTNGYWAIKDA